MKANTLTLTITIRPSYADPANVRDEIEESLAWLTEDHNAIALAWSDDIGEGEWPDDEEDEDE